MARKKANTGSIKILIRSAFLLLVLLMMAGAANAAITNQTAVLSSDLNGDGIAGIGDTITFTCRSTTADQTQYPFVNLAAFGNAYFPLVNIAGNFYSAFFTVSPGSIENNTVQTFQFIDEDGVRVGGSLMVDNRRPNSIYGPSNSGETGLGTVYKVGDSLQIDMEMSSSFDSDAPRANLTNIGLGASHIMSRIGGPDSAPIYRLSLLFPMNREGTATAISVRSTDDAGNSRSWDMSVSYDTKEPEIQSVTAVNMTTGKTWVTSGDTIRIQAVVSNYDFDKLTMYHPTLFASGITMIRVSGNTPGTESVFQYDYYLADVPDVQSNFVTFEVRAKDDAGNEGTPRTSNPLALDNIPPAFDLPMGVSIIENSGIRNDNIAIINDQLYFYGNLSSVMTDVLVTVDLSAIGGVANQIIPFNSSASTTFELLYTVGQYTSENSMPRTFTVTAKDTAGNIISQVIMPIVYVDNTPPTLNSPLIQNISRPGQPIRHGDQLAIQANVTNLDNGSCWVDFERIGGTASSTLSPYSGTTYRLDHVAGDPTSGTPYDQSVAFTIYATDDSGNMVQAVSSPISIDNEPPLVLGSSYLSDPILSETHPYVRVGDRLTFRVQLASSSATIHDSETVKLNLAEFGEATAADMVYDGVASYVFSIDVPAGTLNNEYYFTFAATDNAGNSRPGTVKVKIDNKAPVAGYMSINWLTDLNKASVVNIGDRLELIVPVDEPDAGTCTIDLSLLGGPSAYIMSYDAVLRRYYLIHDCLESATENPSYIFRASVSDKAGNIMNSVSSPYEVDCRPPVIEYASATYQELKGKYNVVNIGDKVSIIAQIDLSRLDGGAPTVNLTAIGGNSSQQLFDDGANNDGIAGDGLYGYTHTVVTGSTDGASSTFTVQVTDNAGNRAIASTEQLFVDNKPLIITSVTNTQIFDNNGNSIVDLDGVYTTYPSVATDQLRLEVMIQGNPGDMGTLTADLTPLGYSDNASNVPYVANTGGWKGTAIYLPIVGTTNREAVNLAVTLTDVNGNEVITNTTNALTVDNRPPKIEIYPISFVVDNGRVGEANLGDVIQIKVRLTNHDGILPMIDFTNLYLDNGMTPPSPTLFPPNTSGGNEFTYQWTVPAGLGTLSALTILAYDESGNMAYAYTNEIRFLSKIPAFAEFPQTRADLSSDTVPLNSPNYIANPGDQVTLTVVLTSLYNTHNIPNAIVLADIRSIINSSSDDSNSAYYDGDMRTYWVPLTYQVAPTSGPGNYVYRDVFTVSAGGIDITEASFKTKVLHPDTSSIVMAESTIMCDPDNPFGIDTQVPYVKNIVFTVLDENNDNIASNSMNIDDLLYVSAEIEKFPDPGSATFRMFLPDGVTTIFSTPIYQISGTNFWETQFRIATATLTGWPAMDGATPRYRVMVTDDADNFSQSNLTPATFTIDNSPPLIISSELRINDLNFASYTANIGDGYIKSLGDNRSSDGIIASITVATGTDLIDVYGRGSAYIDCTNILGTTTYPLDQVIGNIAHNTTRPYELGSASVDLATYSIRIYVKDRAGNKTFVDHEMSVDTTRPELQLARYDGRLLTLDFSEAINPLDFQNRLAYVRLGSKMDHDNIQVPGSAISLDPFTDMVMETLDSASINIMLDSYTKGIIADWGEGNLYISIAHDTTTGEAPSWPSANSDVPLALDVSGNWLKPLPRTLANFPVTITQTYTTRPNLITARYNGNTPSEKDSLYLDFDKDMDLTTIDEATLYNLSIWRSRSNPDDSYSNRYRFITTAASDTINVAKSSIRTVCVRLSQEAQDWIALNYTRIGSQFHMQINGSEYEPPDPLDPPALIRDFEGNRVNPITYQNATPSTLIPLNTQFSVRGPASLDLTGAQPLLQIYFQNSPERRARLYLDPYKNLAETIELSRDMPMDMSLIYLHEKADLSGRSIPLSQTMVDYAQYKIFNTDYASNTVYIPLTAEALKTMLSWGSSKFYIACTAGSFKDLWGNSSIRYPAQGNAAEPITTTFPAMSAPSIKTVAISPAKSLSAQQIQLFKGQAVGNLFYEVAFDTATVSADVYIPVDRTRVPTLQLFAQDDLGFTSPRDTAQFVAWLDHDQGGIVRTVARFANNSDLTSTAIQRQPSLVKVGNFADVYNSSQNITFTETASMAYNLNDKDTSLNGFKNGSYTMVLDSKIPDPIYATPTGTIGITPANGMTFNVAFNEPMDQTVGGTWQPQLRLGDVSNSIMSFTFSKWISSTTAQFTNSAAFGTNTQQGTYTYFVSGGFDEAGNRGNNEVQLPSQIQIRSKGPSILSYRVTTYQSTTAKNTSPTGDLTDAPFSPYVAPGIATITVNFQLAPIADSLWLHLYQGEASLASIPITVTGLEGKATWDGTFNGVPIGLTGPTTYAMRVYDDAANEGSNRGNIIYDGRAPDVTSWAFSNVKTFNGKAYFSPAINSFAKVDVFGPSTGQALKMRLTSPGIGTETYPMSGRTGGGYTISFDGKNTEVPSGLLPESEYMVALVDLAGNLGTALGINGKATSTLVIDPTAPLIDAIQMFRVDSGAAVTRFNPRVTDLRFSVISTDPTVASGTALIKITAGSSLIREIPVEDMASPYIAIWNGLDTNLQPVADGVYSVTVTDLAGNPAALDPVDITVVNSIFKITGVTQVDRQKIRVNLSHDIDLTDGGLPTNYELSPASPAGIGIGSPIVIGSNSVTLPLNKVLNHGTPYTLIVKVAVKSVDGEQLAAGNNTAQFTADTQGPRISPPITYDGLTSQKQFNVTFDEQIESVSAQSINNYTLTSGSDETAIESVVLRSDLKSVTITCFDDITENKNYTLVASDVKDLFGNLSDSSMAIITFQGQDITPPVLTISAFSSPANEFDISVAVKSNEDLSGAPTATITQSGGTAVSLILNAGPNNRMFIGGAHLNSNYPGVATIKVTARDTTNNLGTSNMSFSTAYVNSSVRAALKSVDENFEVVFEPGTLKTNSVVTILNEELSKVDGDTTLPAAIVPSILADLNAAQRQTVRASSLVASNNSDVELTPIGSAYSLNVPAGRIIKAVKMSMKLENSQIGNGISLYRSDATGWKPVTFAISDSVASFEASSGGTFAMLKDVLAPRANMTTVIGDKPIREARPTFSWTLEELASGLDRDSAWVMLDGRLQPLMIDTDGVTARFIPTEDLLGGEHEMSLRIADKAGNLTVTPALRFVAQPPLVIHEVVQFPNPARSRVSLRISTTRDDIDWGEIEVNIYDVSGHKVADNNNLSLRGNSAQGARNVQEVIWDLRTTGGKAVANGVYFARIVIRDPDDWGKKTKYIHKIAVLR
ncbi:MAG: Ig-like domain repeat protein [Candidatus Riflebacteria bacterium]|nr:Ig-like domain repeat protein [Candidatus Riflebacteria bacterium]